VRDNYAAHKRIEIRNWLTGQPAGRVPFTPTSASWVICQGVVRDHRRQAIHRGSSGVTDLTRRIRAFIDLDGPPILSSDLNQGCRADLGQIRPKTRDAPRQ
jgi:hypothetical protein